LTNTPTPTLQATPTRTPKPPTPAPTTAPAENSTPLPPTATPGPTTPPLPAAACPDPNVQLTAPVAGQTFSVDIQLRGTADTPNFAFYKFTLKGPATGNVEKTVGDVVRTPRRDDVLGSISAAPLLAQPGVYIVGLVVVDNTGNEYPHCTLPIVVQSDCALNDWGDQNRFDSGVKHRTWHHEQPFVSCVRAETSHNEMRKTIRRIRG